MTNNDLLPVLNKWFASLKSVEEREGSESTLGWVRRQVRKVVSSRLALLGDKWQKQDVENVCQDALGNLFRELRKHPNPDTSKVPEYPKAYLNTVAKNACHDAFRERNPEWFSMAAKIQYRADKFAEVETLYADSLKDLIAADDRTKGFRPFVIWNFGKYHVCGFKPDQEKAPLLDRVALKDIDEDLRSESDRSRLAVEVVVTDLLSAVGRPLLLEVLVSLALAYTGGQRIEESLSDEVIGGIDLIDTLSSPDPDPEAWLAYKQFIFFLWKEVMLLPEEQGQVTGLNLEAVVKLSLETFLESGAATEEDFDRLIEPVRSGDVRTSLPLSDSAIAELLQMIVDRVRDLRGSAKKRIQRRCLERTRKI